MRNRIQIIASLGGARLTRAVVIAIIFVGGTVAVFAQQQFHADHTDRAAVKLGSQVYVQHCAVCHGANLEGEPDWTKRKASGALPAPPHDPSGHTWHHSDEILFKLTKFGVRIFAGPEYITDMPAYEKILTDEEILAVISYIKSTWPEEILEAQERMSQ
ncbi:MAG: cytochrome c [Acidiferrobacterales bacterium]|nr:cytochrome c [Acidiferrobacterales bacterium]